MFLPLPWLLSLKWNDSYSSIFVIISAYQRTLYQTEGQVWWTFVENLWVSVSLSSGYDPQANEQRQSKIGFSISFAFSTFCKFGFLVLNEQKQNILSMSSVCLPNSQTQLTPFWCEFCYQLSFHLWLTNGSRNVSVCNSQLQELQFPWSSACQTFISVLIGLTDYWFHSAIHHHTNSQK